MKSKLTHESMLLRSKRSFRKFVNRFALMGPSLNWYPMLRIDF